MRHLFMADRYHANGDVEAEPVIATVTKGRLRIDLDDGTVLLVDIDDIVLGMALDMDDAETVA